MYIKTTKLLNVHKQKLTASKGGSSPTLKLIVLKFTTSKEDDILLNGPYTFPSTSLNSTDFI